MLAAAHISAMRGLLTGDLVVATTMSNMGLEAALKRREQQALQRIAPQGAAFELQWLGRRCHSNLMRGSKRP